ncbi:hypothetical protein [Ruegeria profundi]|uniref:hypothetical protein n=1 Tax=Ruegeria profundi TaxID=1685378 RepID=UPI001CD6C5D3|nr:hypothetical protein [Ruegeria profundi]MCA0927520.1 hypothetical protein [Ruegeria profundi]
MAEEKVFYPQIPTNVWWGVRELLHLKPTAVFDERLLATQLGVQEAAAKAYLKQLVSVGVLDENGRATEIANKWRLDDTYKDAADEIVRSIYPESLLLACPPENIEREKVVNWFMMDGLGKGSAGNKAATYILLSKQEPQLAATSTVSGEKSEKPKRAKKAQVKPAKASDEVVYSQSKPTTTSQSAIPLNLNLQIHISADATSDQIDQIFKSMRNYLYDYERD